MFMEALTDRTRYNENQEEEHSTEKWRRETKSREIQTSQEPSETKELPTAGRITKSCSPSPEITYINQPTMPTRQKTTRGKVKYAIKGFSLKITESQILDYLAAYGIKGIQISFLKSLQYPKKTLKYLVIKSLQPIDNWRTYQKIPDSTCQPKTFIPGHYHSFQRKITSRNN